MAVFAAAACVACFAAERTNLILVESPDAPGRLSLQRLQECLRLLEHEAGQDRPPSLPLIIVLHVSEKEAKEAGFHDASLILRRNTGNTTADRYYELWVIGEPSKTGYVIALNRMLEDELKLKRDVEQQNHAIARVARWLDAITDVKEQTKYGIR